MVRNKDRWSALSMEDRAALIDMYVKSGITDLGKIRKDYNGIPYKDFNSSEYDYFNAHPSNAPTKEKEHWTSRNPKTGRLLKREDHPTFDLMIEGEKQAGYKIIRGYNGELYSVPNEPTNYVEDYNSFSNGGPVGEGGYPEETLQRREEVHKMYDPTGGAGLGQLVYRLFGGNSAKGEENEYWKAYLGLPNDVPKMNSTSKTEWDDTVEEKKKSDGKPLSDFYGTTDTMDLYIQAMADTTTVGKIIRNYDAFKKANPSLAPKSNIEALYKSGKVMMDNPNKWTQVGETFGNAQLDIEDRLLHNEQFPLGMLAAFGAKWIPEESTIHIHDTYDFPKISTLFSKVPERPKEMKIRGKVKYNPKNIAKLFNSENFNLIFPK